MTAEDVLLRAKMAANDLPRLFDVDLTMDVPARRGVSAVDGVRGGLLIQEMRSPVARTHWAWELRIEIAADPPIDIQKSFYQVWDVGIVPLIVDLWDDAGSVRWVRDVLRVLRRRSLEACFPPMAQMRERGWQVLKVQPVPHWSDVYLYSETFSTNDLRSIFSS